MNLFPLISTAALRPTRLDEVTFHIASDTGVFSVGFVNSADTTVWLTTIGVITAALTYLGGTIVPATTKAVSFTAGVDATEYQITVAGLVVTLSSLDPIGTRYEFSALASLVAPNTAFTPNGGRTISGAGPLFAQVSISVTDRGYWRAIEKQSDGNWLMSGL